MDAPLSATRDPLLSALLGLAEMKDDETPAAARNMARLSLFDWASVARAGRDEPVARVVREFVLEEAGHPEATLVGSEEKVPARAAALANGSASHALDYDDTHFGHIGHVSVAVLPAALAVAEAKGRDGRALAHAFLLGAEVACRVGLALGRQHYLAGFHQTATSGAFGATVAAGVLFGLDRQQLAAALGVQTTRASGMRTQFGTMGKPFNAGMAAANGVEAAALAARGFTSCDVPFAGPEGFLAAHQGGSVVANLPADGRFLFEENRFKLHACCHGLHAMIEALSTLKGEHGLSPDEVVGLTIITNPRWLSVCDLKAPRTGLELKFSYSHVAAMVLEGIATGDEASYTDGMARSPSLGRFAERVRVVADDSLADGETVVELSRADRAVLSGRHDLADPVPPDRLVAQLREKSRLLLGEAASERLAEAALNVDALASEDLRRLIV